MMPHLSVLSAPYWMAHRCHAVGEVVPCPGRKQKSVWSELTDLALDLEKGSRKEVGRGRFPRRPTPSQFSTAVTESLAILTPPSLLDREKGTKAERQKHPANFNHHHFPLALPTTRAT
jgi:hypothetical protein